MDRNFPFRSGEETCRMCPVFIHFLSFCLSEMTNDCLAVLRMCCSSTVLQALELLVSEVTPFKAYRATACCEVPVFQTLHHRDWAGFRVPGAVCVRDGRDASEERRPGCAAWRHVWKGWTPVCLLQCVPEARRGHGEDRNKAQAGKPSPRPVYRCQRPRLIGPLWVTWTHHRNS